MERNFKRNPNGERNRQKNNWREGTNSLEQALVQFEPLVQKKARYYYEGVVSVKNGMLSLEDLCQEGRIAIMLAYNTYDIRREAQLSTWVYHMIDGKIKDFVKKNLSSSVSGGAYLFHHMVALEKEGLPITVENLVKVRGITYKTAAAIQNLQYYPQRYGNGTSAKFYDSESGAVEEYETDMRSTTKDIDKVDGFHLEDFKKYLTESEFFALKNHYGIDCDRMTMQEIGERLGKSRKATSYMINRALNKLRHVEGIEAYAPLAQ